MMKTPPHRTMSARSASAGYEFVACANAAGVGELLEVHATRGSDVAREAIETRLQADGYLGPFVWLGARLSGPWRPFEP